MSKASFDREFLNDAAVPWKSACKLAGIPDERIFFCTLSISVIASPSDALGDRLNDTVTEGNCP